MDLNGNSRILALFLGAVIITSGCVGQQQGGGTGPGLVIQAFEPDLAAVESLDNVRLRFRIENSGGEEARFVLARLIGINPVEWNIPTGTDIQLGNFLPANPSFGTAGTEKTDFYELIAPVLPEGQRITYNPILRVYYNYRTTVTQPITLVTEEELRRLSQEGESLPTGITTVSGGPLLVTVKTGNLIKATTASGIPKLFPVTIRIENTGPGSLARNPFSPAVLNDDSVLVSIRLPPGLVFSPNSDCQAFDQSFGFGNERQLFRGRDLEITCEILITNPPVVAESRVIIVSLDYDYFVDSTTQITVKGTETGEIFGSGGF